MDNIFSVCPIADDAVADDAVADDAVADDAVADDAVADDAVKRFTFTQANSFTSISHLRAHVNSIICFE